jgi:hypothetical protein
MRINCLALATVLACLPLASASMVAEAATADGIRDANRLLRVTNVGKQFDSMAQQQTGNIIRTYSLIVSTSTDTFLPAQIKQSIAACYAEAYAWQKFEAGIAKILADNFSQKEMRLLIDFYRNRSLPPVEIQSFKNAIAKGGLIQKISAQYIFADSDGCVERDARLILDYLSRSKPRDSSLATE